MKFGLDFGTTNSAIAIDDNGVGKVLEIDAAALDQRVIRTILFFHRREMKYKENISKLRIQNNTLLASDFYFEGDFNPLIGQAAVNKYLSENKNRKEGVVRTIFTGRILDAKTLQEVKGGAGAVREYYQEIDYGTGRLLQGIKTALKSQYYKGTSVFGKFFTLEELIATFVGEIKKTAELLTLQEIDELVCGRPVYFSENPEKDKAAQDRLEEGLKQAGFKKITFQFEPIAAANQYIAESGKKAQTVFVFDFGGGTLDTAIVEAGENSKVLSADGVYIGGDLLNADICREKLWKFFGSETTWGENRLHMPLHIYEAFNSWYSLPNLNNPQTMQLFERLRYKNSDYKALDRFVYLIRSNIGFSLYEAIEKAKKQLSSNEHAQIIFKDGPIDIDVSLSKGEFEKIIKPRVEEIRSVVLRTLEKAGKEPKQIDVVVRTGGSSLIPVFEQLLISIFGKEKIKQFETFTSIAGGLALEK